MSHEGTVIKPKVIAAADIHLNIIVCILIGIMLKRDIFEDNISRIACTSEMNVI